MMNIRKIQLLFFGFVLFAANTVKAQQDPMFTQYMFNMLAVNPAYAGSHDALSVSGLYRNQWVGIEGAPVTQTFFAHSPFFSRKVGVGLSLVNDRIGPIRQTMLYADYSYTIQVTDNTKLAMGLKAGVNMLKTTFSEVDLTQSDDAFQDISLSPQPNFGFGLYYYSDKFFAGVSCPKLMKNKLEQKYDYSKITLTQHFFVTGGYVFTLNDQFKFKPTTMVKLTGGAPPSVDLNASVLYREKVWAGLGYRFGDSFNALLQIQMNDQLKIGYSYDYTLSKLSQYNSGSHEIMISYDFIFRTDRIISPRYF